MVPCIHMAKNPGLAWQVFSDLDADVSMLVGGEGWPSPPLIFSYPVAPCKSSCYLDIRLFPSFTN